MIVGHAAIGFLLVTGVAALADHRHPVALGLVAALAAMTPDVDIITGMLGVLHASFSLHGVSTSFAAAADLGHRGITHTLVAAVAGGLAAGVVTCRSSRTRRVAGLGLLVVGLGSLQPGALGLLVAATFIGTCTLLAIAARRRLSLSKRAVALAIGAGVVSHPFGDVLAGDPPRFFAPFSNALLLPELTLYPETTLETTLQLLSVEIGLLWASLLLASVLTGFSLRAWLGLAVGGGVALLVRGVLTGWPYYEVALLFGGVIVGVAIVSVALTRRDDRVDEGGGAVAGRVSLDVVAALSVIVWTVTIVG